MFDMGFMELMLIGVLGLLVLGPERLPQAARTLGLIIGRIRRSVSNFQEDLERQARTEELKARLRDPAATFLDDDILNPASLRKSGQAEAQKPEDTTVPEADSAPPAKSVSEATTDSTSAREDTPK